MYFFSSVNVKTRFSPQLRTCLLLMSTRVSMVLLEGGLFVVCSCCLHILISRTYSSRITWLFRVFFYFFCKVISLSGLVYMWYLHGIVAVGSFLQYQLSESSVLFCFTTLIHVPTVLFLQKETRFDSAVKYLFFYVISRTEPDISVPFCTWFLMMITPR